MPLTLINAGPSPFGRKVAIAMQEKGIEYVVRYDLPWGNDSCTPQFSPLRQLPIVIAEDGEYVYDSVFILEWLEARYPAPPLVPVDGVARLDAKKRQMLGERLMEIAQSLIFEMHRPDPSGAWIERQTQKIVGGLLELERLHTKRASSSNTSIDLGDIAIGTTLLLFEYAVEAGLTSPIDVLVWRDRYASLTSFIASLETRPSFLATLPRPMEIDLQATVS